MDYGTHMKADFVPQLNERGTTTLYDGEERRTAEIWTFERRLGASDPNWALARVEPATA